MSLHNLSERCPESELVIAARRWTFRVSDTSRGQGLHCSLDGDIWLDWKNIFTTPREASMHMYLSCMNDTHKVGMDIKRMRMATWQAAVIVFNQMMIDVEMPLQSEQVISMLHQQKIPRPERVFLPTTNPTLVRLLNFLGIREDHSMDWNLLVEHARSGKILRPQYTLSSESSDT